MTLPNDIDALPQDGFDRQNLVAVRKRFLRINALRLKRMRDSLNPRQLIFLDLLPLLFHSNHPMMPGFISRNTPARVSHYKPSKADITSAKTLARSFTQSFEPDKSDEIYGIYIMGSVGTIAQSESSDLDIWLCHKPHLDDNALTELNRKAEKVSEWALTYRLEVHIFLMDYEAFKQGQLSDLDEESSGSAQKLLLLDEFYRTAIFIAGRMPLWWFIPDTYALDYQEYAHDLLHKRFLNAKHVLDFGSVAHIPDGEFIGAGIWQLYKAIESPYKSVLKLLLLEAYASDHPHIEPLALTYKELVYTGIVDIDQLDSYVMIYRRIEQYLLKNKEYERLELARRCFYFKVKKPLSKPPKHTRKSWQRHLLEALTQEWGWDMRQASILDGRANWKAVRVTDERALLVNELNHSYHFLLDFANKTGASRSISSDELTILGRKLQAAFERRPGKIEWINPNISADLSEEFVVFKQVYDDASQHHVWTAYALPGRNAAPSTTAPPNSAVSSRQQGAGIKSANSIIELALWCHFNGIITPSTQVDIEKNTQVSKKEIATICASLRKWLPLPLEDIQHNDFAHSARPIQLLLLINIGERPNTDFSNSNFHRLSDKNDALRYGGAEENLIFSVDMVTRNSWNEITTRRFYADNALLDCLLEYLKLCLPGTHQIPPKISIKCIDQHYAATILNRVQHWLSEILHCYYGSKSSTLNRFVFQLEEDYCCLQFQGLKPIVQKFPSLSLLIDYLSQEQTQFSQIVIDSNALKSHPLKALASHCYGNSVNVFFRHFDIGMEIYVVDEKGSLFHTTYRGQRNLNPLKAIHHFLRSVTQRQMRNDPSLEMDFGIFPINFFELSPKGNHFSCTSRNIAREIPTNVKFDIKAIGLLDKNNHIHFNFYCDDQEFSALSFGHQLDEVVAQFVLGQRENQARYPIYINDMDLSLIEHIVTQGHGLQITHYLRLKQQLEDRLNQAIGINLSM